MDAGFDVGKVAEEQSVKHGNCKSRDKLTAMGSSMGVCDRRAQVCHKVADLRTDLVIPQGAAAAAPPPERKNRA